MRGGYRGNRETFFLKSVGTLLQGSYGLASVEGLGLDSEASLWVPSVVVEVAKTFLRC